MYVTDRLQLTRIVRQSLECIALPAITPCAELSGVLDERRSSLNSPNSSSSKEIRPGPGLPHATGRVTLKRPILRMPIARHPRH